MSVMECKQRSFSAVQSKTLLNTGKEENRDEHHGKRQPTKGDSSHGLAQPALRRTTCLHLKSIVSKYRHHGDTL